MENKRSPSIPLTAQDLRAIASSRLTKQYNKRLILVIIPTLVMAIAGIAFHREPVIDIGFVMVGVAMAGFLGGAIVVGRWFERAKITFAKEYEGVIWRRS